MTKELIAGIRFVRILTTDETQPHKKEGYEDTIIELQEKDGKIWIRDVNNHLHLSTQVKPKE